MQQVDNIIIGAGPGGYELAAALASSGESVIIVERNLPGGTCLNRGCIPTKCLCATAATVNTIIKSNEFGINIGDYSIDYPQAIARMRNVVTTLQQGIMAEISGCTYIQGEAKLMPDKIVTVGEHKYQALRRLIIATGSSPAVLPIKGSDLAMTSDDILADDHLPSSIIIVGGGVIGMEFASIFNSLGVETTVIEYCKEILPPFEPDIAKRLRTSLGRKGINIIVGAAVNTIYKNIDGLLTVEYQNKRGVTTTISGERVVMAVGRRPVIPEGAVEIGLNISEKGFIEVDELMQTNLPGIYAIGDVNGLSMLAHSAIAQGRVVATGHQEAFQRDCIPSVVFTSPEVAMVGRTSAQLDVEGIPYRIIKHQFASNGKACSMGENEGNIRIICHQESNVILGVSIIGPHAADLIAEATILIADQVTLQEVPLRYIHAHPTLSEIFI